MNAPVPLLIADSGSGYGGTTRYLLDLLPHIDRDRYRVTVVGYAAGPFIEQIRNAGWPAEIRAGWRFPRSTHDAELGSSHLPVLLRRALVGLSGSAQLLASAPVIARELTDRRIRLVHLNNEIRSHLPLLWGAHLAGCRTICHLHGWRELTALERACGDWVDEFVSVSRAGAAYFGRQLPNRTVHAAPNGARRPYSDDELQEARRTLRAEHGIAEDEFLTLLAGRLVGWKGHGLYLLALAAARRTDPRLRGLVVGHDPSPDGAYRRQLERQAASLGLAGSVTFLPFTRDVWPLYAAADLVVHASTIPEPFGLVVLEAMLAGRPVVATRAGGVLDMVTDGETGLLVTPGSVQEMCAAMLRLRSDPELAARLVAAAGRMARDQFTIERNARAIHDLYGRALGR